jgi:Enolase C-terminal domain-like
VGGILEAREIAAMAEAHYLQISPHVWGGPLIAAAAFQIDVGCPNFLIQEAMGKFGDLHAEILESPIEWKDGYMIPSHRPGLWYELNEAKDAFQRAPRVCWLTIAVVQRGLSISGVEKRRSDVGLPVVIGQVFTCFQFLTKNSKLRLSHCCPNNKI